MTDHRYRQNGGGRQAGFSVVELLLALTLMAFLAASLLTVISTGGEAFRRVLDVKAAQSEARIAISYVTVKLRRNSSGGKASVVSSDSPANARNVLKIDAGSGPGTGESCFIYFDDTGGAGAGRLVEKIAAAPNVGDPAGAVKIADISDFSVSYANEEKSVIRIAVSCDSPDGPVSREVSVALRANP